MAATCTSRVTVLLTILYILPFIHCQDGGRITSDATFAKAGSPYRITRDIEVPKKVKLTLEPGVVLRFSPGIGMTVEGTLEAKGTSTEGIVLTADEVTSPPVWPKDTRLVGEHSIMKGILQLNYRNRWRNVCSNFRNWTQVDVDVACNHLGFLGGNFTFNHSAANFSHYMLYERPSCGGLENNLLDCQGKRNIKTGAKICENQEVVGLSCTGLAPNFANNFWKGIRFVNSTVLENRIGNILHNVSASILEYVTIKYAGVDHRRNGTAAVWSNLYPPRLRNVIISDNANDGMNFTDTQDNYEVTKANIRNNRGHGLVAWPRHGTVTVQQSDIHDNSGDGIHTVMNDVRYWRRHFARNEFFCTRARLATTLFPLVIPGEANITRTCTLPFRANSGQVITLDFLYMDIDPKANASIEIRNGERIQDPLIANVKIINGTQFGLPQSVTTTNSAIHIVFKWKVPRYPRYPLACRNLTECVRFVIKLSAGAEGASDLKVYDSKIYNNIGRGVYMQDARSIVRVNNSHIDNNQYHSGLHIANGSCDVQVNNTQLRNNQMSGINITTAGGRRILKNVRVVGNEGVGIYVGSEKGINKTRHERDQRTEIMGSFIQNNTEIGVKFGNYCVNSMEAVMNYTLVEYNKIGVEVESCIHEQGYAENFTLQMNTFRGNSRIGVKVVPMVNMIGKIWDCTFEGQEQGAILIQNSNNFDKNRFYKSKNVTYEIFRNTFKYNRGRYVVNLQLTPNSMLQSMKVWWNSFADNEIPETVPGIKPRSRASAVIVLSSANIEFRENVIENPKSVRQMTTHLLNHDATISAINNFWGNGKVNKDVFFGIMEQKSRYNLAKIKYTPICRNGDVNICNPDPTETEYVLEFRRTGPDNTVLLGGILSARASSSTRCVFNTSPGTAYRVDRDIQVPDGCTLNVQQGTNLLFDTSVGMLVQGVLQIGSGLNRANFSSNWEPEYDNETDIRLVGGRDELEGRVEVRVDGVWGTVCSVGWSIQAASVVCAQLGYTVHPSNWHRVVERPGQQSYPIWYSNVQCTTDDMDIRNCEADQETDHSCDHSMDVSVKCLKPAWAGIRITSTNAQKSVLRNLLVEKAGLMDYAIQLYKPAIQIDMNKHQIEDIEITDSVSSGLAVMKNDISQLNLIQRIKLRNNLIDGFLTRSSSLELAFATIENNGEAGVHYDPRFTEYEAWDIRSWLPNQNVISPVTDAMSKIVGNQPEYFVIEPTSDVRKFEKIIEITAERLGQQLVLDVLDFNPDMNAEKVVIFNGAKERINDPIVSRPGNWTIDRDLVDFPVFSDTQKVTIKYTVNGKISGRLGISARSVQNFKKPHPIFTLRNSTLKGNKKGLVIRNYNQPSNDRRDLMFRYFYEEINVYGLTITESTEEAVHAPSITKFNELIMPSFVELTRPARVANITIKLHNCVINNNAKAIIAEHNHVEFSNNVWHWRFYDNKVTNNRFGGLSIELPRTMDAGERLNNSIDVNNTLFKDNTDFEFAIRGFHANVTMYDNQFVSNQCRNKKGLILLSGMEKNIQIHNNSARDNIGKFMVEFNLWSHVENATVIPAQFTGNRIQGNNKFFVQTKDKCLRTIYPSTYTVGVRGVQRVVINRNLFGNEMDFELVANVPSSYLGTKINVKLNWWGTTNQTAIRGKIFDFDDWNSYAVAEYYPFLTSSAFNAVLTTEQLQEVMLDVSKPLGGRITKALTLRKRAAPYRVISDLTVMPGVLLRLEAGVKFEFNPNVGILVLGDMSAEGTETDKIEFSPVKRDEICNAAALSDPGYQVETVRLRGSTDPSEGFVEMYNATNGKWSLICDPHFHSKTAQVLCRTMGKESNNVHVRISDLYDYYVGGYQHPVNVPRYYWRHSMLCQGEEDNWDECLSGINYNLWSCVREKQFAFVRCGARKLSQKYDYWGNIRFASPTFEQSGIDRGNSIMRFVRITGAGMLHGVKAAAVQSIHRTPLTGNVTIEYCASNGFDFIAPKGKVEVSITEIANNLGYGVGVLVLNGESRTSEHSSFESLNDSIIPYNTFALVQMCDSEKEITVRERMLLYFKYSYQRVDCVKIVRSESPVKTVAIRFLQYKLYEDNFTKNAIEIFDGAYINGTRLLAELLPNSTMANKTALYQSTQYESAMTLHIHASPAEETFGFIAEVVTLPLSPITYQASTTQDHTISNSRIHGNDEGAIRYMNVGEINPDIAVRNNLIRDNGIAILNFTSLPCVWLNIQNTRHLTVKNNFITKNKGGLMVYAVTSSLAVALNGNITNNVIYKNTNGTALGVIGHHYQKMLVTENYITFNHISNEHAYVIHLDGVVTNMTRNVVHNNTAYHVIHLRSEDNAGVNQTLDRNHIYWNNATDINTRTTIFAENVWQRIHRNYLLNDFNNFELATNNITWLKYYCYNDPSSEFCKSIYYTYYLKPWDPKLDPYNNINHLIQRALVATDNWWGSDNPILVEGRVWDGKDDVHLFNATYEPYLYSNRSMLEGNCQPGWKLYKSLCFQYMGGHVPMADAKDHCEFEGGVLAKTRNMKTNLGQLVARQQDDYNVYVGAWVQLNDEDELESTLRSCYVLRGFSTYEVGCSELHSYICQKVPTVFIEDPFKWRLIAIILGSVGGGVFVLVGLLIFCFCMKSRQRKEEQFKRRDSIRSSIRINRSAVQGGFNSIARRRKENYDNTVNTQAAQDLSIQRNIPVRGATMDETLDDDMDKMKLEQFHSTPNNSTFDLSSSRNSMNYQPDHGMNGFAPRLENEIANIMRRPLYDSVYQNSEYDDRSLERTLDKSRDTTFHKPSTPMNVSLPDVFENKGYDDSRSLDSSLRTLPAYTPQANTERKPSHASTEDLSADDDDSFSDGSDTSIQKPPAPMETDI